MPKGTVDYNERTSIVQSISDDMCDLASLFDIIGQERSAEVEITVTGSEFLAWLGRGMSR